jgi:hypothetical protein
MAGLAPAHPALSPPADESPPNAQPAFGDPGWVAPFPVSGRSEDPASPGPRVNAPQGERGWETALRLPFRVVTLPFRAFSYGLETVADPVGSAFLEPPKISLRVKNVTVSPRVGYSGRSGPAIGLRARSIPRNDLQPGFVATLSVSWFETIRFDMHEQWGVPDRGVRLRLDQEFRYSPNERFYGIGNEVGETRGIYLRQEGRVGGVLGFGSVDRELRAAAGVSIADVRRGYHGQPKLEELFDEDALGFPGHETVGFLGAGATFRNLDDDRLPSRGVSFSGDLARVRSLDDSHLRYWEGLVDAAGYAPVFARRRVLLARAAYRFTDPTGDSNAIPFYRLPDSSNPTRFAAYSNHRLRDRHLALAHVEYRWELWERIWAVGFAQVGTVAPEREALRIADVRESYGGGLRAAVGRTRVARAIVATGRDAVRVYLTFGETF